MIDVSNFSRVHFVKHKEFKNILTKIVMCYEMMCNDCVTQKRTLPNNENQLRDILHYGALFFRFTFYYRCNCNLQGL